MDVYVGTSSRSHTRTRYWYNMCPVWVYPFLKSWNLAVFRPRTRIRTCTSICICYQYSSSFCLFFCMSSLSQLLPVLNYDYLLKKFEPDISIHVCSSDIDLLQHTLIASSLNSIALLIVDFSLEEYADVEHCVFSINFARDYTSLILKWIGLVNWFVYISDRIKLLTSLQKLRWEVYITFLPLNAVMSVEAIPSHFILMLALICWQLKHWSIEHFTKYK